MADDECNVGQDWKGYSGKMTDRARLPSFVYRQSNGR